jgi:thioredoxin 1
MKLPSNAIIITLLFAALLTDCSKQENKTGQTDTQASATVLVLNDSNFDSQVQSGVVLVDFWATWCGPCKAQGPIVEQVAKQVAGKAKVAKLDVDSAHTIAQRFNIEAIPTLVVFKNGKPVKQFVGLTNADKIIAAISSALGSE